MKRFVLVIWNAPRWIVAVTLACLGAALALTAAAFAMLAKRVAFAAVWLSKEGEVGS